MVKEKQYTARERHKHNTMPSDKKSTIEKKRKLFSTFFKHFIETKEKDKLQTWSKQIENIYTVR